MTNDKHERLVAALAGKPTVPAACIAELGGVRAAGSPVLAFFSDPDNPGEMFDLGWRHPLTREMQHDADCYRVIVGVSGGPLETLAWNTGIVPVEGSAVTWIRMLGDKPWWEIPDYSKRAIKRHGWDRSDGDNAERDGEVHELGALEGHLKLPRWEVLPKQTPVTPVSASTDSSDVRDAPDTGDSTAAKR